MGQYSSSIPFLFLFFFITLTHDLTVASNNNEHHQTVLQALAITVQVSKVNILLILIKKAHVIEEVNQIILLSTTKTKQKKKITLLSCSCKCFKLYYICEYPNQGVYKDGSLSQLEIDNSSTILSSCSPSYHGNKATNLRCY